MYNKKLVTNSHHLSMNINKSNTTSSISFKRKSSGHIPLLSINSRPLSDATNINQRNNINNKSKRKTDEYENDSFEYNVATSNYASVRKHQQELRSSSSKRLKSIAQVCIFIHTI